MAGTRIMVVEDERAVARGLVYALTKEGFSPLWAENGTQALEIAHKQDPRLILLDIRLPDISGFDVCKQLRMDGLRQPILFLTARDDELDKVLGLELGADDYVVKPYNLRELIARIRAQLRRAYGELAEPGTGEVLHFGDVEVDLEQFQVNRSGKPINLTPIEFRLLRTLSGHPNHPFERAKLIEIIWGYEDDINNDRTVDVHIRHLREKLEEDPANPRWIVTVRGLGYKFQA